MEETKKKKFAVPHVYILLFALIAICSILTYIRILRHDDGG